MSNLGLYQEITKWSKKCGGPEKLLLLVATGGYLVFRPLEAGVKWTAKQVKKKIQRFKETSEELQDKTLYLIVEKFSDEDGLFLEKGDKINVITIDDDAVIISKLNDNNNPYVISFDNLKRISNYSDLNQECFQ